MKQIEAVAPTSEVSIDGCNILRAEVLLMPQRFPRRCFGLKGFNAAFKGLATSLARLAKAIESFIKALQNL